MKKEAVICFLFIKDELVMINRNKPPFMGMWNAIGGKVEKGETPEDATVREVMEESGIEISKSDLTRLSRFTWNYDDEIGYAFIARINKTKISFPLIKDEGIIALKSPDWVLNDKNFGVIEDLRVFLADIKKGESHDYHLIYENSRLTECILTEK